MTTWLKHSTWNAAAFAWGVAEGTLFFIVPDVLLSFVGLRRGVRAGLVASVYAALGASVGGAIMYLWSAYQPVAAHDAVLGVPAISNAMAEAAHAAMISQGWFVATLAGPLTSTPYKVYAMFAPHVGVGLVPFAAASVLARLPRFLVMSLGLALIRHWFGERFGVDRLTWALGAGWVIFYAVFFVRTPG